MYFVFKTGTRFSDFFFTFLSFANNFLHLLFICLFFDLWQKRIQTLSFSINFLLQFKEKAFFFKGICSYVEMHYSDQYLFSQLHGVNLVCGPVQQTEN